MPSTGAITIAGKTYAWTSPRLADLEEFEATIGPITDVEKVNSIKGRCYLAHLCLREKHPDLLPGVIRTWDNAVWGNLWEMITQAIPMFAAGGPQRPPANSVEQTGGGADNHSPIPISSPSSISLDGQPIAPARNG